MYTTCLGKPSSQSQSQRVKCALVQWCDLSMAKPSQGGQYYRITPLEEGMAQAHDPAICEAPLYAAAGNSTGLWPHFMQWRSLD